MHGLNYFSKTGRNGDAGSDESLSVLDEKDEQESSDYGSVDISEEESKAFEKEKTIN